MIASMYSVVFMHVDFRLESPMTIGSGLPGMRIVCDADGIPYVPATSMAGVLRHSMPQEQAKALFGYVSTERGSREEAIASRVFVGDGRFAPGWKLVFREGVALDERHTAIDGAKYNIQAIDRGAAFTVGFELEFRTQEEARLLDAFLAALSRMNQGDITLGAKRSRGLGRVSVTACRMKTYEGAQLLDSVGHDPSMEEAITLPPCDDSGFECLCHTVRLRGALCVRDYVSLRGEDDGMLSPHYVQLTANGSPVIPGMSWAGMFRHAAAGMLRRLGVSAGRSDALCAELFGVLSETDKAASNVLFEDTALEGGRMQRTMRTAINRFSGGAANGALYREEILYAGEADCSGPLTIRIRKGKACSVWGAELMRLLLRDLSAGRMYIGGGGAIGRGVFAVDGADEGGAAAYPALARMVRAEMEGGAAHEAD